MLYLILMDYTYVLAQIIGSIAFALSIVRFFQKNKELVMKFSILTSTLHIIHYILLGAIFGCYTLIIALFRDFYIYQREKHHKKYRHRFLFNNILVLIFFATIYLIFISLEIKNPINILPPIAGLIYLFAEWFANKIELKIWAAITSAPWLIYDFSVVSIPGILLDISIIIASLIGAYRDSKKRERRR